MLALAALDGIIWIMHSVTTRFSGLGVNNTLDKIHIPS